MNDIQEIRRLFLIVGGVLTALLLAWYLPGLTLRDGWVRDGDDYVLGRDFLNFWMMGRSGLHDAWPGLNYRIHHYVEVLQRVVGEDYRWQQWSYPPTMILLMLPFGLCSYLPALGIWVAVNLASFMRVVGRQGWLALLSPAAVMGLICGQISLLAAAVTIAAFRLLDRRPVVAGVLIGFLTIKPHLGILFPLMLLVMRCWKTFLSAAATSLAMLGACYLIYGPWLLKAYLRHGIPLQHQILEAPSAIIRGLMPTVFMDLRVAGAGYDAAMAGQVIVALVAAMSLLHPAFRAATRDRQLLLFALASVLASPYLMAYDLMLVSYALLVGLAGYRFTVGGRLLVVAVFAMPLLHFIAVAFGMPGVAMLPAILLGVLLRSERRSTRLV